MPDFDFSPTPHEEAARLIEGKPVVSRQVFDSMLPELRARVFTITGIEGANVLQQVRDEIAGLARDTVWDEAKQNIIDALDPYLGEGAERRAELLLRTHGFQAFQAANWRVAQEDGDTTHLQYLATEDDRVRDSHLALNGIILPKDDPFWEKHYPPWEWGCRCRVRPMNPDLVDEARQEDKDRAPDDQLVLEGPAARKLNEGTLVRNGRAYDVTAPSDTNKENAFEWHPDNLRLPVQDLEKRYDPAIWSAFKANAQGTEIEPGITIWQWLNGKKLPGAKNPPAPAPTPKPVPAPAQPPTPAPTPAQPQTPAPPQTAVRNDPVSQKFVMSATKKTNAIAGRVAKLIDQVHDDGKLNPIDVTNKVSRGAEGTYYSGGRKIGIRRTGAKHPEMTFAHEVGHWIDEMALPGPGFSSESHPALAAWRQAVQNSQAYKNLKNKPQGASAFYVSYTLRWREIWARSYAQFIATRSGDAVMLKQMEDVITGNSGGFLVDSQWSQADFKSIALEIENVLKAQGWL